MFTYLFIAVIITAAVALFVTLHVGKNISSQINEYESEGDSHENELARSHDYESQSLRVNIKTLSWIYIGLGLVVLIVCIGFFIV